MSAAKFPAAAAAATGTANANGGNPNGTEDPSVPPLPPPPDEAEQPQASLSSPEELARRSGFVPGAAAPQPRPQPRPHQRPRGPTTSPRCRSARPAAARPSPTAPPRPIRWTAPPPSDGCFEHYWIEQQQRGRCPWSRRGHHPFGAVVRVPRGRGPPGRRRGVRAGPGRGCRGRRRCHRPIEWCYKWAVVIVVGVQHR